MLWNKILIKKWVRKKVVNLCYECIIWHRKWYRFTISFYNFVSVDLRTKRVADAPIIVDKSPPIAGHVYDGPLYKTDLMYTKDSEQVKLL